MHRTTQFLLCRTNFPSLTLTSNSSPSFYDGDSVQKFIIPILPEFHSRLFTDYYGRQTKLPEFSGEFIVEGNTIKKAYLCNGPPSGIKRGDVILFYRTGDLKKITSIGIVEKVLIKPSFKEVFDATSNRTVYTEKEIREYNPSLVILFKQFFHLPREIGLKTLTEKKVIKGNVYTLRKIDNNSYLKIKRLSELPPNFTKWQ